MRDKVALQPRYDPAPEAVQRRLAKYDRLHQEEGHTLICACSQVYAGKPCSCGTTPQEEPPA